MYIEWNTHEILYTRKELLRLHRHFKHPSDEKLWNLIKRAAPQHADTETRNLLASITRACETCTVFSAPPQRFRVSFPPSKISFNKNVAVDLMWLDHQAVLHVVDTETYFNAAAFIKHHTVESLWDSFVYCWAALYTGFPEKLKVDHGSAFTSIRWTRRCDAVGMEVPTQSERMKALAAARTEMATITAELRVRKALMSKVPRNADLILHPGDQVRVYRETDKKYVGPYPILRVDDKQVFLLIKDKEVQFSLHQVILSSKYDSIVNGENTVQIIHNATKQFRSSNRTMRQKQKPLSVHITEIVRPKDPRAWTQEVRDAKQAELKNLAKRGTWKIVSTEEVPPNSNILTGMFVISIKNCETDNPVFKARYVIHGHKDREKEELVHSSTTVQQSSTRLIVSLAAMFGFRLWSQDISQAYLQSASKLLRDVYLRPGQEFDIPAGHILKLLRPLYGLADSGDYWNVTFSNHLLSDLEMKRAASDLSLFFKTAGYQLRGLTGTYVDDTLSAGDPQFFDLTALTGKKFDAKDREVDRTRFAGVYIEKLAKGFKMHQQSYIDRIKPLPPDSDFKSLRAARAQLAWLIHTRPDICACANILAQVTADTLNREHIKKFNRAVRHLHKSRTQGLTMVPPNLDSIHIRVYSDSSFANNDDMSSQLGYFVLLCDKREDCNIVHFTSHKSRRVTRSVLGAETYAFADGFDFAYSLKSDLQRILQRRVALQMLTDSKSLFDIITKCSNSTERRLMIDMEAIREAYQSTKYLMWDG
eukprot:IDg22791t1